MTARHILTTAGIIASVGLATWGFLRLGLTGDQQVDFAGAAFGSFVAAATALGVVEFQARRETGRIRTVVDHLLWEAHEIAQHYLDADPADVATQESLLFAFANTIETASTVASDNQHRGIGMARASHALRTMMLVVDQLELNDGAPERVQALQDTITKCRVLLTTTSRPSA